MNSSFRESFAVQDGTPLRQGDIFAFRDDLADTDMWQQIGVVVTADCDLANSKHSGIISYVPVLPIREYLAWRVLPKLAEQRRLQSLRRILEVVRQLEASRGAEYGLSERAIEVFATTEDGHRSLIEHFGEVDSGHCEKIVTAISEISTYDDVLRASSYEDKFALLASKYQANKKKSAENLLVADIRNRLDSLPGDTFFIGALDESRSGGYIAYLRLVREIRVHQISTTYYHKDGRQVLARRICRLRAPYIYRLTQLLADVFASIGLPEEYEAARASIFESCLNFNPTEAN